MARTAVLLSRHDSKSCGESIVASAFCPLRGGIPPLVLVALWAAAPSAERSEPASLIIPCASSCEETAAAVRAAGGHVTIKYENIKAIAATIPADRLVTLATGGALFRDYVA